MSKRIHKYRAWNKLTQCFFHWDISIGFQGTSAVYEETEQFTGIRDGFRKDGEEIYAGHVVRALSESGFEHGTHKGELFIVYWFEENGAWYISRKYRSDEERPEHIVEVHEMLANCDVEVVGSLYANPNLLSDAS